MHAARSRSAGILEYNTYSCSIRIMQMPMHGCRPGPRGAMMVGRPWQWQRPWQLLVLATAAGAARVALAAQLSCAAGSATSVNVSWYDFDAGGPAGCDMFEVTLALMQPPLASAPSDASGAAAASSVPFCLCFVHARRRRLSG